MKIFHTEQRIRGHNILNLKLLVKNKFFLKHLVTAFMEIYTNKTFAMEYVNISDITTDWE